MRDEFQSCQTLGFGWGDDDHGSTVFCDHGGLLVFPCPFDEVVEVIRSFSYGQFLDTHFIYRVRFAGRFRQSFVVGFLGRDSV